MTTAKTYICKVLGINARGSGVAAAALPVVVGSPAPPTGVTGALTFFQGNRYFVAEAFGRGAAPRKVQIIDRALRSSRPFAEVAAAMTALAFDGARGALYIADFGRGLLYRIRGPFGSL